MCLGSFRYSQFSFRKIKELYKIFVTEMDMEMRVALQRISLVSPSSKVIIKYPVTTVSPGLVPRVCCGFSLHSPQPSHPFHPSEQNHA